MGLEFLVASAIGILTAAGMYLTLRLRTFPVIRDLVTDISWNYRVKEKIKPLAPRAPDGVVNIPPSPAMTSVRTGTVVSRRASEAFHPSTTPGETFWR